MALNVGELYSKLTLQTSEFDKGLDRSEKEASSWSSRIGGILKGAAVAGLAGFAGLGAGILGAGKVGWDFNNTMELTRAQINAFTKDAGKTENILAMVQERASKTPFAFEDMATAAAALIPSANASGLALEDLIAQAEILAASNPAQG